MDGVSNTVSSTVTRPLPTDFAQVLCDVTDAIQTRCAEVAWIATGAI